MRRMSKSVVDLDDQQSPATQPQISLIDKPTKKQSVTPSQNIIAPPKYSFLPAQQRMIQPNLPNQSVGRRACRPLLATLIPISALFCLAIIFTAIIVGVLCATNVICLPTYYYYCPQGYDIQKPTVNAPATDTAGADWSTYNSEIYEMRQYFNNRFTIGYCGSDTTSSSTSYYCEGRTTNNNFQSYCVNSCTTASAVDCNKPTISSSPLANAVPYYTVQLTNGQTNAARKILSSGFTYVSCPVNYYWDVRLIFLLKLYALFL